MTREKSQITKVKELQIDELERKILILMSNFKSKEGRGFAFRSRAIHKLIVNTVTYPLNIHHVVAIIRNLKIKGFIRKTGGSHANFYYWSITKKGLKQIGEN